MSEYENTVETPEDTEDEFLPEGWSGSEDENFFDPSTWGSVDTDADAQEDYEEQDEGYSEEDEDDQTRTTGEDDESETEPSDDLDDPTTVLVDEERNMLRFRANIDHVPQDIELDPADLPTVYQKSLVLDRYQKRVSEQDSELSKWDSLAAGLKYANRDELFEGLFEGAVQDFIAEHPSIPEEMARDYITRQFNVAPAPQQEAAQDDDGGRDFKTEVADLFRAYPNSRNERIPDEVTNDALASGKPLVQAYAEWKARTASAEATRAKRENKILKQNQAAAARAPVSRVTGGGKTDTHPVDDFLQGFMDDNAW